MTRKITFFFTCLLFCINLLGQNNGRPIKLVVSSLIEAAKIKNFNYDKNYKYTIIAKEINDGYYKYQYLSPISKVPISDDNPKPIIYTIIIEKDGFDNPDYIAYKIKGQNNLNKILKSRFNGIKKLTENCRYELAVEEQKINNEKYLKLLKILNQCDDNDGGGNVPESYTIIIEKDGFDVKDYVKYRVEGTNDTIQFPIDHFINANFTIGVRNILKVKEVENNNQTYLEILVPKQPKIFDTLIVSSQTAPCSNNPNLQCLKITATDGWNLENIRSIKNFVFEKGYKYTLQVQKINTYEYVLVEILSKEEDLPCPNPPPTVFYDCDGSEKRIATCNEVIYTNYMLEDDNSMKIRPVDQDIPFFKFYGNICGFTFIEDHKYTLEVKKDGNDYILEKILCDEKKNILPNPNEKKFTNCGNSNAQDNPKFEDEGNKDSALQEKPKPTYKITELDSGVWYLRYLFQADSLIPINNLSDTSYYLTTDTWRNKINIFTPCNFYFDKLSTDEPKKFVYESLTVSLKKCDATTKLIFEQLRNINHYEINDNKLKLSVYNNDLQDAKVLIVLEGVPKRK